MQTTLLGLAIAVILAILAALLAPLVVDWNHYRTAFENEVGRLTGLTVRVGTIDARILPTPLIKLRDIEVGVPGGEPQLRASALELELRLGPLFRGEVQASQAHLVAPQFRLALDRSGAIALPALSRSARPDDLSISRLRIDDGSVVLADAASGAQIALQKLSFDGDVRSLAGPFGGEGSFVAGDQLFSYRLSGGRIDPNGAIKIRLGVDPANAPLTTAFDGMLTFDGAVPQFAGTFVLTRPVGAALPSGERVLSDPWSATGSFQATPASAALRDIAFQYGPDERAINFTGTADLAFGATPHFDGEFKALEVDADRALAAPDVTHRPPLLVIKDFAGKFAAAARLPMPGQIAVAVDGLRVGGTNLQALRGKVRFDDSGWSLDGLDLHAPGLTDIKLSGRLQQTPQGVAFAGPGALDSGDADMLMAWLGGHAGAPSARTSTLQARGDVAIAGDRLAVDGLTATLDQETLQGRVAYTWPASDRPAIVDADLHATKLDLDALAAFAKSAVNDDGFELPRAGSLALDIGKVTLAGVDARAVKTQIKFDAGALQIAHLSIADLAGAALDVSGRIDALTSQPSGRITVDVETGALAGLVPIVGRFAPRAADVLRRSAGRLAPAKLHGVLAMTPADAARSSAKLELGGQLGLMRLALNAAATGEIANPGDATIRIDGRLDADDGTVLAALFGAGNIVGVDQLPGRATFSAVGPLNGDLSIDSELAASGFDATLRGAVRVSGDAAPSATLQMHAAAADLRPLAAAMTGQPGAAIPVSVNAGVAFAGNDLVFTQIAAAVGKSSVNGRLAVKFDSPVGFTGDIAADDVDAVRVAAMLLGLPRQGPSVAALWSNQPVGSGAFAAMNGVVNFKFDRAAVSSALTASGLSGVAQFRPSEIVLDNIGGSLAGGQLAGQVSFRRNTDGLAGHGHIELAGADAATLLQADKKSVDGKLTLKLEGDSIGATPEALVRALHGGGAVGITDAHLGGLDTAVFAAAMRVSDPASPIEPAKILSAVTAALANGHLGVPQGETALTLTAGKLAVANATLQAQDGSALALGGTLDVGSGAIDARMTLSEPPPANALIRVRPEYSVALKGPLEAPVRTLDISALTGWLAQRAAELQTRRIESIETNRRGDVIGRAIRPASPIMHPVSRGVLVESGTEIALPVQAPGRQALDLLQPQAPTADASGLGAIRLPPVRPPAPPAAPRTAGPDKRGPLDLLFRPQN